MKRLPALTLNAGRPWVGFAVADRSHEPVGRLRSPWTHAGTGQVQFFGIQAAGAARRDLLVPTEGVEIDAGRGWMRLPYGRALVQEAPACHHRAENPVHLPV